MARMKSFISVLAIGLGFLGAGQRVRPLSLAELTQDSDLIVVAKLAGSVPAASPDPSPTSAGRENRPSP